MQCIVWQGNYFLSSFGTVEQTHVGGSLSLRLMKKDTQFTLRISMDLKRELQNMAATEGRSMAQICEAFLRAGSEGYKKEGPKFLRRFLGRQKSIS
jgi:hypothetical protein